MNPLPLIIGLGALVLLSAFFSGSEMAYASLNRAKLKNLASRPGPKARRARRALALTEQYDRLLSAVLIGNNIVNIASSTLATVLFVGFLGNLGITVATVVMTALVLIVGEISPKTLAKEAPESFALFAAPLLSFFMVVFRPVTVLTGFWRSFLVKLFQVKGRRPTTEAELLSFVEEVRQEGGINQREEDMIRQAIEFDDLTVNDIYTPRVDLAAVSVAEAPARIEALFLESGYSRLPVYRESVDHILGMILFRDFARGVLKEGRPLSSVISPVVYVTKSMRIARLLRIFQEKKSHLAVLVDEFGVTLGIVTIEDIVEELVGEIWDEHEAVVERIVPEGGGFRVLGSGPLREFFDFFGIDAEAEKTAATTVGSWAMEKLGGIVREGDVFDVPAPPLRVRLSKVIRHRASELFVEAF